MIQLQLPVDPVPASRPRVTRKGFSYYAEPYRSFKKELREMVQDRYGGPRISVPCGVTIAIFKSLPKTTKLRNPKPDVDNYAKAVLDAMNGIVFDDDSLVVKLIVTKQWAAPKEPGRVLVFVDDSL